MINDKPKVALVGNMNNNNFAILRYLRDLGINAHLLLMVNDYTKSQAHFAPENDTFEIEKWKPFIHYLSFTALNAVLYMPKKKLHEEIGGYDIYIGSGLAPVILDKCGIRTDIYYPYAIGIEGVGDYLARRNFKEKKFFARILLRYLRKKRIKALRKARKCFTAELSLSKQTFEEIGVEFERRPVPLLYNKLNYDNAELSDTLLEIAEEMKKKNMVLFSHTSHMPFKKNYFLDGYAMYKQRNKDDDSVFVLLNYGTSVDESKKRIKELGIEENVLWLPQMTRKEIMYLLSFADIGFSEFYGAMWGGTGWEFMSQGIPFFHQIDLTKEEFEKEIAMPFPPIMNVTSPEEICDQLIDYTGNRQYYKNKGAELKEWFDKYGGIGLAEKYKDTILNLYEENKLPNNAT